MPREDARGRRGAERQAGRRRRVAAHRRHEARRRRRLRGRLDARALRRAVGRGRDVLRRQHDEAGAVHRCREGAESPRLARRPRTRLATPRSTKCSRRTKPPTPRRSIVGRRWTIEHGFIPQAGSVPADEGARSGDLGAESSLSGRAEPREYWGPTRAAWTTPVRAYLDQGFVVAGGTDSAVVPYPPLWVIYHFVTRDTISGGVLGADQKITRSRSAASRNHQQRFPYVRRAAQGIDRARQARRPRRPAGGHPDLSREAHRADAGRDDDGGRQGRLWPATVVNGDTSRKVLRSG